METDSLYLCAPSDQTCRSLQQLSNCKFIPHVPNKTEPFECNTVLVWVCLVTIKSRNNLHSDCAPNQGLRPKYGAAGPSSMSCDVSLLSPFSYIDNTVGCFNYSPSVGESKPLQRHTLIPLPSFSLQGTHCLLNIISLSSVHTIGLKCGSFAEGVRRWEWGVWHLGIWA